MDLAGRDAKLSFSFSSSKRANKPRPPRVPVADGGGGAAADDGGNPKSRYVTEFDPSMVVDAPEILKIEPIPNADILRRSKKMKNLEPPLSADDGDPSSESRFVLDTTNAVDAPSSSVGYGLTIRRTDAKPQQQQQEHVMEGYSRLRDNQVRQRYAEDMAELEDERGQEEFADISVEDFAASYCRGYGWSAGKGIGKTNRAVVEVVEYDKTKARTSFGSDLAAGGVKSRRLKGGEVPQGDKFVRVIAGKYVGSKAKVVIERFRGVSEPHIVVKLLDSDEKLKLGLDMVADLGSVEEENCLRKLKQSMSEADGKGRKRREESSRRDAERSHSNGGSRHHSREDPVPWLRSHIRVKIISKDFRGGKLYLKKGKVVDVVGPMTCDISLDGTGELVQGVDQKVLETALPKSGGHVLVLFGKHRGVYGSLIERDMEKDTGVVRDADNHSLVHVKLEQIAEYVGDPGDLGY